VPEKRLERTRRVYRRESWFDSMQNDGIEELLKDLPASCGVCGGTHSDGGVCERLEPTAETPWGV